MTTTAIKGWWAQPAVEVVPTVTLPSYPTTTPSGKPSLKPTQVAAAYNLPAGDGSGVTVGVLSVSGAINRGVLNAYCGLVGVTAPPSITQVSVDGGTPQSDGAGDAEAMLDMIVLSSLVPKANFRIYYAPDNSNSHMLDSAVLALSECDLVSCSYGNRDTFVAIATQLSFELALREARTRGVSFFCSSGDSGSDAWGGPTADGYIVPTGLAWPANCPSAVSVGATAPTIASGVMTAETGMTISGGGASRIFPGVSGPVVSAFGDFTQGYAVPLSTGAWSNFSSTSGSCPFMAAVHTRLVQNYGKPFDFMDFACANPSVFNDITTGTNGAYTAATGRDMVTGFGSPKGSVMLAALANYPTSIMVDGSS